MIKLSWSAVQVSVTLLSLFEVEGITVTRPRRVVVQVDCLVIERESQVSTVHVGLVMLKREVQLVSSLVMVVVVEVTDKEDVWSWLALERVGERRVFDVSACPLDKRRR